MLIKKYIKNSWLYLIYIYIYSEFRGKFYCAYRLTNNILFGIS